MEKSLERPDQQSLARVEALRALRPGAHVHVSGICGTGVSAVAVLLKNLGFRITGTDKAFYPPMGDLAKATAEKIYTGYTAENLTERPEMVVIGNNLSRNNPEVEVVFSENIPYVSMPEAFQGLLIGTREECKYSIVVSGTHGKTTTSAAVATILDRGGFEPGYFIGGIPLDLPGNIRAVNRTLENEKRTVVLEGDEYDSAFFAKWSKFHSYRPDVAIVTSIEFDHADIFPSIKEIEEEFLIFLKKVPSEGLILFCDEHEHLHELAAVWQNELHAPIRFYGERESSTYRLLGRATIHEQGTPRQSLRFSLDGEEVRAKSSLLGKYNALNLLAASAAARFVGMTSERIPEGVETFRGVLRRQRTLDEFNGVMIVEDFAHHPSAVAATLQGLREGYPGRRIICAFEPRSNTSRRSHFQHEFEEAFANADVTLLPKVTTAGGYSGTGDNFELLNSDQITRSLRARGKSGFVCDNLVILEDWLIKNAKSGDLICLMSNGDFGGIQKSLPAALRLR